MLTTRRVDRVFEHAVEAGLVPGVIALAANEHGVVYEGAFGRREIGKEPSMTLDSVVRIASMTKAITSVAALQLVEQGRLALDEPLGALLPELAAIPVLDGFDAAGAPRFRPPRRAITLRHLLTHTAGFAYTIWDADLLRLEQHNGVPFGPLQAPLVFDPGECWSYGISIDWVGWVVEQISGLSLEEYFRAHILDRLGMRDTSFLPGPEQRARVVSVHRRRANDALDVLDAPIPERSEFYNGGGDLFGTGPDYLRFLRMFLGGGQLDHARVLRTETVAEMACNQIGHLTVGILQSVMPDTSHDVEFFAGLVKKWGLSGMINTAEAPTGRTAGSWAWAGLYNTYFWIDPTRSLCGLILTQILPFGDAAVLDLFAQFERLIYAD
jgi:CubicO group peptidase (beta-lactamase class C family)